MGNHHYVAIPSHPQRDPSPAPYRMRDTPGFGMTVGGWLSVRFSVVLPTGGFPLAAKRSHCRRIRDAAGIRDDSGAMLVLPRMEILRRRMHSLPANLVAPTCPMTPKLLRPAGCVPTNNPFLVAPRRLPPPSCSHPLRHAYSRSDRSAAGWGFSCEPKASPGRALTRL